jgi:F-type H+-transporting ATPase subunit epsilon
VPRAEQQLDRGVQLWKEAGDSEEAYDEALRIIAEAEAKMATAAEKR